MSLPRIWPEGQQCAAVITVNFEGESVERQSIADPLLWGRNSYGRYGAQLGVERILSALDRYGVTATFFISGWDAERYPREMEQIAKAGHEVAGHGYLYEDFGALSTGGQQAVLERSEEIFETVFGARPVGWRAPGDLMASDTRALLAARGYRYDSSYCDDDLPYVVAGAQGQRLVELPHFPSVSDQHYYAHYRSPHVVTAALSEELSAVNEAGGLFNVTIHPRGDYGSGRGVRIRALEALLREIHEQPRVWLTTCREVADWMLESAGDTADVRDA